MLNQVGRPTAIEDFQAINSPESWLKLVDSPEFVDGGEGAVARDRAHRDLLFSPEIDPVWNQIEKTIGPETGKNIRDALKQIH